MGGFGRFFGLGLMVAWGVSLAACSSDENADELVLEAEYIGEVLGEGESLSDAPLTGFDSYRVDSEGVVLVETATGRAFLFDFGVLQSDLEQNFTENLGLTNNPASNDECGAGPMDFAGFDGLTLNYQDGNFVGWSAGDPSQGTGALTLDGITIGSTRAEIEALRGLQEVADSTIGHEFSAEGISFLLSGTEPDAAVTDMWAGTNCIFR